MGTFNFDLVVLPKDEDLFTKYLKVDKAFGLSKAEAEKHKDTEKDAYIAGLTNFKGKKPFIFINKTRSPNLEDAKVVLVHELFHLTLLKYNWDMKTIKDKEEDVASFQEKAYVAILKELEKDYVDYL